MYNNVYDDVAVLGFQLTKITKIYLENETFLNWRINNKFFDKPMFS